MVQSRVNKEEIAATKSSYLRKCDPHRVARWRGKKNGKKKNATIAPTGSRTRASSLEAMNPNRWTIGASRFAGVTLLFEAHFLRWIERIKIAI